MDNSVLTSYARLRLLVGYLGEKAQANWWSTSFFEKVSRTFLEPVFPRTYQLSQYNGVRQAASLLHDEFSPLLSLSRESNPQPLLHKLLPKISTIELSIAK